MGQKINLKHHFLFWFFYLLASSISEGGYGVSLKQVLLFELFAMPFKLFLVYFNWHFLIPKFFDFKKITNYLFRIGLTLLILTFVFRSYSMIVSFPIAFPEFMYLQKDFFQPFTLMQILLVFTVLIVITTFWQLYLDWLEKQRTANLLQLEKRETELKYLKSQINPHFLFNTLNTIYSLSLEKSTKVPRLLLKLSEFLSFSLYETNNETVPIHKEIALIENFVELQKDRFVNRVLVNSSFKIENYFQEIPPMLLITFVENAFKHSLKNETGIAEISIELNTDANFLIFDVKNTKGQSTNSEVSAFGIGLKNIRRRLDLIYIDNYILDIKDTKEDYEVSLKLNYPTNEY